MDEQVYGRELIKLGSILNRNITEDFIKLTYKKLEFIPNEAWTAICNQAIDEWDSWPRNFVKIIKAMWFGWQKERKVTGVVDFQDCAYCLNTACLDYDYWHSEWERWLEASCFCGHCNNSRRHTHTLVNRDRSGKQYRAPRYTVEEIADKGWKWHEPPPPCTPQEAFAAIHDMIKKLEERAEKIRLARFQQVEFDRDRPTREESLEAQEEFHFDH